MHDSFSEWYRLAGIPSSPEILLQRWQALEAYIASASAILQLTQLFYGSPNTEVAFIAEFAKVFDDATSDFAPTNSNELSLLAGAKLIDVIQRGVFDVSTLAELSLVTAASSNLRGSPHIKEIPEIAAHSMARHSIRRFAEESAFIKKAFGSNPMYTLPSSSPPTDLVPEELRLIHIQLLATQEECNILWWIVSEHSREFDMSWSEMAPGETALICGRELADLVVLPPGPVGAVAMLNRIIRTSTTKLPTTISVKDAINGVSKILVKRGSPKLFPVELPFVTPISCGIRAAVEDQGDWATEFTKRTGVRAGETIAPHLLAYQSYLERLLFRAFEGAR